jgi:hypothetical protein
LRIFITCSLFYLGELVELSRHVRRSLRETRAAGDLVGSASMSGGVPLSAWLVDDEPAAARSVLDESRRRLTANRFSHGVYWVLFGDGLLSLYCGGDVLGYQQLRAQWQDFLKTRMHFVPASLVPTLHLRGALAVAACAKTRSFFAHADALSCSRRLRSFARLPGAVAMASLIEAAVEHQRGHRSNALNLLVTAAEESRKSDLACFASVARLRLGTLLRDEDVIRRAWDEIGARGVARPDRFARIIAPGFPEPPPVAGGTA